MSESYNGWTNYETWCVHLWLSNDEGLDDECRERCDVARGNLYDTAEAISDLVDEMLGEENIRFGLFSDLLTGALSDVNYQEIAEGYAEAYHEQCVEKLGECGLLDAPEEELREFAEWIDDNAAYLHEDYSGPDAVVAAVMEVRKDGKSADVPNAEDLADAFENFRDERQDAGAEPK